MSAIADTGFLVALIHEQDQYHSWAVQTELSLKGALLTCEAVLAESAFHLRDSVQLLKLVETGFLKVPFRAADNVARLSALARKYADRSPDLADLCLICLSEEHPQHTVITTDARDFRVYRRNGRERIPLLLPPELQ